MCVCVHACTCAHACAQFLNGVQLSVTPWNVACKAPLPLEFFRQEYWNVLPFPTLGTFLTQGSNPCLMSPALADAFFTTVPSEKPDITAILDISYKGNDTICILLSLTSFTLHYVFKIHPCRSAYQYLNPFYCPVTIPSMNISHFSLFSSVDGEI